MVEEGTRLGSERAERDTEDSGRNIEEVMSNRDKIEGIIVMSLRSRGFPVTAREVYDEIRVDNPIVKLTFKSFVKIISSTRGVEAIGEKGLCFYKAAK